MTTSDKHVNNPFAAIALSDSEGSTTDTYVDHTIMCLGYVDKLILLKNTHGSRSLHYKVTGYAYPGSTLSKEILAETTLTAGNIYTLVDSNPYAVIVVSVKSAVAGNPATFLFDRAMHRR